jgi:hypothetical protein
MGAFEFSNIVCEQLQRIEHSFGNSYPDELLNDFKAYEDKYHCNCGFKSIAYNTADKTSSFKDNWKSFQASYPKLVEFCGGLAAVFPHLCKTEV